MSAGDACSVSGFEAAADTELKNYLLTDPASPHNILSGMHWHEIF